VFEVCNMRLKIIEVFGEYDRMVAVDETSNWTIYINKMLSILVMTQVDRSVTMSEYGYVVAADATACIGKYYNGDYVGWPVCDDVWVRVCGGSRCHSSDDILSSLRHIGRQVTIIFSASSSSGNLVFWKWPTLISVVLLNHTPSSAILGSSSE
jgi:hypothetical protein